MKNPPCLTSRDSRYGVAFIVAYIGVQLILSTFRYVPEWSTCAVSGLVPWRNPWETVRIDPLVN